MQASTECYCSFLSTNVTVNEFYRSACITAINADNILGYSKALTHKLTSYTDFVIHEIRVGQIHRRPTRPKIRVGLVLHVLHGSGAYDGYQQWVWVIPTTH